MNLTYQDKKPYQDRKLWYNIIYTLFILGNTVINVDLLRLDVYALILGFFVINKINWETRQELLYYLVLLFSVMDFTFNLPLFGRFNIYYFHIALFVLMLSMGFDFLRGNPLAEIKKIPKNKYSRFLAVFIGYGLLSLLWVEDYSLALKYIVNYAIMISYLIAVYKFNPNREKIRESLKVLLYSGIFILIIGLAEVAGFRIPIRNVYSDYGWYVKGPEYLKTIPTVFFYNPNNYAVFLLMFMSFVIPLIAFAKKHRTKWLFVAVQVIIQVSLIFTMSRTVYLTMYLTLAGFVVFFGLTKEWTKAVRALKIGFLSLLVFYVLSFVPAMSVYYSKFNDTPILNRLSLHATQRPQAPLASFGAEGSASERYTILVDVTKGVLLEGQWYGFGVNNTGLYVASQENTHGIANVHSLWFEILGDFGVVIFLYLIYIYLSLLWDLLKAYLSARQRDNEGFMAYLSISLLAALGGFVLTAFAPSSVISFSQMWLLLGLAARVANVHGDTGLSEFETA